MIRKIKFKDLEKLPLNCKYIKNTNIFKNDQEIEFSEGLNLIIGKNGCGKSTLINIIGSYLMCNTLMRSKVSSIELSNIINYDSDFNYFILDGVDVEADYRVSTFKIIDKAEGNPLNGENVPESFIINSEISHKSRGESNLSRLGVLSSMMYNPKLHRFDVSEYENNDKFKLFSDYIKRNNYIPKTPRFTLLLDEPDNNLDMYEIDKLGNDLIEGSETSQILAVVHNPALIYKLSQYDINIIEMSEGYMDFINEYFNKIK